MERRLAAILAADVVGYSRLIREDEAGTLAALMAHREQLIAPKVAERNGRIVKLMGDGILVEFPSAVEAVQCAVEIQHMIGDRNADVPKENRIAYRIGINIGDIVVEDNDIYGDGVNVAARLEGLAEPSGICVARNVFDQVKDKLDLTIEHLGEREVKNIAEPVTVYRVVLDDKAAALVTPVLQVAATPGRRWWPLVGAAIVAFFLAVGGALWLKPWTPEIETASIERMAFPLPDKPSIAVLPFQNLSGDQEQEYFSDGMINDIITDLSRFSKLFVIASNSTFSYKGKAVKVQQVAEELGVRYVLEGSIQKTGERLRINAQLIDATTGRHLWAERYDRNTSDFFAIQEDIVRTIVASLAFQVTEAEIELAVRKDTDNLKAYDYYLRGRQAHFVWGKEATNEARGLLEKAIELDPDYALAHSYLTWIHVDNWRYRWGDDPERSFDLALESARKAIALDPDDYESHWALGFAYLTHGEFERAEAEYERALALNPYDAEFLVEMAELLVKTGKAAQAVTQVKTGMRINPRYPDWYLWNLGWAQYFTGQYDEALAALNKMSNPYNGVRRTRAAVLVRLGRIEEAREVISKFIETDLEMTLEEMEARAWKDRDALERWIEDLRTAGLPEKRPLPLPE
jgi:TolB-like protein/class 3 adenylate cyclase